MDVILTGVDSEQVVMDTADADVKEAEEEKAMAARLLF